MVAWGGGGLRPRLARPGWAGGRASTAAAVVAVGHTGAAVMWGAIDGGYSQRVELCWCGSTASRPGSGVLRHYLVDAVLEAPPGADLSAHCCQASSVPVAGQHSSAAGPAAPGTPGLGFAWSAVRQAAAANPGGCTPQQSLATRAQGQETRQPASAAGAAAHRARGATALGLQLSMTGWGGTAVKRNRSWQVR
jgi:hypothetical protein